MITNACVALGGNTNSRYGGPINTLKQAVAVLERGPRRITRKSKLYQTAAFPAGSGPDFINAAIAIETEETAGELLTALHEVEAALGRERRERWGARPVDLDLITYGQHILPDLATYREWHDLPLEEQMRRAPDGLIVPHPRMHERSFVLVPLADIASEWVHPVLGCTVQDLLSGMPEAEKDGINPVNDTF